MPWGDLKDKTIKPPGKVDKGAKSSFKSSLDKFFQVEKGLITVFGGWLFAAKIYISSAIFYSHVSSKLFSNEGWWKICMTQSYFAYFNGKDWGYITF